MVRAILSGRKSQTRRLPKRQPTTEPLAREDWGAGLGLAPIPDNWFPFRGETSERANYALVSPWRVGNILWVREAWATKRQFDHLAPSAIPASARSSNRCLFGDDIAHGYHRRRPSIHMPRWAARIFLRVEAVRLERLRAITEADAQAEGVESRFFMDAADFIHGKPVESTYRIGFQHLWDEINGKRVAWASNPFVWAVTFSRVVAPPKPDVSKYMEPVKRKRSRRG